jgi:hypothetical protein
MRYPPRTLQIAASPTEELMRKEWQGWAKTGKGCGRARRVCKGPCAGTYLDAAEEMPSLNYDSNSARTAGQAFGSRAEVADMPVAWVDPASTYL